MRRWVLVGLLVSGLVNGVAIAGQPSLFIAKSSPAAGAGVHLPQVLTDFCGNPRPNPPSVGAFEPGSACEKAVLGGTYQPQPPLPAPQDFQMVTKSQP